MCHSVVSDSLRPLGLQPTRLLRPWGFPGKSTGVGCHCLLRFTGIVKFKVGKCTQTKSIPVAWRRWGSWEATDDGYKFSFTVMECSGISSNSCTTVNMLKPTEVHAVKTLKWWIFSYVNFISILKEQPLLKVVRAVSLVPGSKRKWTKEAKGSLGHQQTKMFFNVTRASPWGKVTTFTSR